MSSGLLQEEPILSRLNRLDHILKQLEDIKSLSQSPRSSYASTNSSYANISPEQRCRPVEEVLVEVEQKGTLIQRLIRVEDRIFKLCMQLEDEMETERSREINHTPKSEDNSKDKKSGFKKLVKSCVGVGGKHKKKHKINTLNK